MTQHDKDQLPSDCSLPTDLLELFVKHVDSFDVMPDIAMKAIEIADREDGEFDRFAELIAHDLQITSHLLRIANSPRYGLQYKVANLAQAVRILGFRQCKNLIMSTCISSLMKSIDLHDEWIREVLGDHSLTTAILAHELNRRYELGFEGEEFTAGLIHDIGRTFFAAMLPDRIVEVDPLDFVEDPDVLNRETRIVGTNHAELGAYFAITNRFPAPLVDAVRFHHNPRESTDHITLVALVAAADHLANHVQLHDVTNDYIPETNEGIRILDDIVRPGISQEFSNAADDIIEIAKTKFMESLHAFPA